MKSILFALALTLLLVAISRPVVAIDIDGIDFSRFLKLFNKTYIGEELKKRKTIFENNVLSMIKYNGWAALLSDVDSRLGVTEYSDLDPAEFIASYTGLDESGSVDNSGIVSIKSVSKLAISSLASTPSSLDWRSQGIVNSIKNQGQCGSCWTFSVTSAIESAYAKKYGSLPRLSEQELLDCVTSSSYGCNGGSPRSAASFAVTNGMMPSSQYPYAGKKKSCGYSKKSVTAKPYNAYLWKGSEADLTTIVSKYGPVAVVIYASSSFQNYKKGVFYDKNCLGTSKTNHAVTIVGYGRQSGKDYWLVRNQWGTNWGESGYFKLTRGSNHCNVMTQPIYITFN